jgi:hypothetical protein
LDRGSGVVETTGARRGGEVGDLPVSGEVVVPAAHVVVHPSRVCDVVSDLDRFGLPLTRLARGVSGGHDDSPQGTVWPRQGRSFSVVERRSEVSDAVNPDPAASPRLTTGK